MRMACLASELSSSTAICHPWPHRWRSTFPQRRGIGRWSSPKRLRCASVNVRCYFQLIPPPYPLSSLEPYMSQETVERHWGRHHREHLNSLNTHIAGSELNEMPLEEIVLASYNKGDCLPVFIHAAQTWNHDFFWQSMKPGGGGRPSGILLQLIERDFGSFELFLKEFKTAALTQFGSGWVWLTYKSNRLDVGNAVNPCPSAEDHKLVVAKTPNAINPLVWDYSTPNVVRSPMKMSYVISCSVPSSVLHGTAAQYCSVPDNVAAPNSSPNPLLAIDVWEHAYYLDYENQRAEYISVFMDKLVSWDFVSSRLAMASARDEERARKDASNSEEDDLVLADSAAREMFLDSDDDDSETE